MCSFSIRSEVVLVSKEAICRETIYAILTPHANRHKGNKIMGLGRRDHSLVVFMQVHVCHERARTHRHTHTHV